MKARGDTLTFGVLAALAASAAWSGRRGGRNLTEAKSRQIWEAVFPDLQDLSPTQISALRRGEIVLPDGTPHWDAEIYVLKRTALRNPEAHPVTTPTVRGKPAFRRHRLMGFGEEADAVAGLGAVLALEAPPVEGGDHVGPLTYYYLPSTFEIVDEE